MTGFYVGSNPTPGAKLYNNKPCLVLVSGGQDSITSLYWARAEKNFSDLYVISFDYAQKHSHEINIALALCSGIVK